MGYIVETAFSPAAYHDFYSHFSRYNERLVGIVKSLLDREPARILDMACGTGLSAAALREHFQEANILGVDIASDLIEFAQASNADPEIEFRTAEILATLDDPAEDLFDLVFVKSAYHYFDQQVPFSRLKESLRPGGAIVIAERTARSAASYPLPDIARDHWEVFFAGARKQSRFDAAKAASLSLSVSCYGEFVQMLTPQYLNAVKASQIFGISALKDSVVTEWLASRLAPSSDTFEVFEEFWLYLLQNPTD